MELKCPACTLPVAAPTAQGPFECPHCGAGLRIEVAGEGFALVSRQSRPETATARTPPAGEDPVLADYLRWRTAAVFAMAFGGVCLWLLLMAHGYDLVTSGLKFMRIGRNRFYVLLFGGTALATLGGGLALYTYLGRERQRYLAWREARHTERK